MGASPMEMPMTLELEAGHVTEEVVESRRVYLKAGAHYAKASARRRRMPCTVSEEHRATARGRLRAAYADYLDALATAGLPLPRSAR